MGRGARCRAVPLEARVRRQAGGRARSGCLAVRGRAGRGDLPAARALRQRGTARRPLRPPDADHASRERELAPGEVVAFPAGLEGAHRLDNRSDEPVRVLLVSTMRAPEINAMLEDGRYWLRDYVPGTTPPEGAFDVWTKPD